jgi:hypothetical protein
MLLNDTSNFPISPHSAELPRKDLRVMLQLVRLLNKLSENSAYQSFLNETLPAKAQMNNHHHAVMMGYDFHLSPTGLKLIEVNTNAGGLWFASCCYQPETPAFPNRLGTRLLQSFISEYRLFCKNPHAYPHFIVILDEKPETQFLYSEMQVFAQLFRQAGIETAIVAPENLSYKSDGIYFQHKRIDLIYNRHCDFYLENASMSGIREAWLNGQICLTPNPFMYGLLADKRRMIIWSDPELLTEFGLNAEELTLFSQTIPQTLSLSTLSPEQAWSTRKQWVFKPDNGYGSRGVYVGDKLTKGKLTELNPYTTLIQQRIPASITRISDELAFKTDFRLFVYRSQVLAVSARLYQGQVTNLRTENGGFAKVCLPK